MKLRSRLGLLPLMLLVAAGCQTVQKLDAIPSASQLENDDALAAARRLFYEAVEGRDESLSLATRFLEKLGGATSADPVVVGYFGSCRLLAASKAVWPWEMGRLAKEGLTLQDQAVAAAPESLDLRALRGLSNYRLPGFFNRGTVAADDLAFVAAKVAESPVQETLEPRVAAAALYHHGLLRRKAGDVAAATSAWRLAMAISPDAPGGRAASRALRDKSFP